MQEYNWKKEREKYRPDFMKQPEPAKQPAPPPPPVVNRSYTGLIFGALAVVVVLIAGIAIAVSGNKSGDVSPEQRTVSSTKADGNTSGNTEKTGNAEKKEGAENADSAALLAAAAEKYKTAVGVVVLNLELKNGKRAILPIGTAWAFDKNKFATNGHVAMGIKNNMQQVKKELNQAGLEIRRIEPAIIINGSQKRIYSISHVQIHPDYGTDDSKFDPDVAVLTIQGNHDVFFKIAGSDRLNALKSGEPIAFLGFPMEGLIGDNINPEKPVASMQSGIVVAVSDFELKDAGAAKNFLVRHNLPSTGGASGSPIFNRYGEVVALLFAGNIVGAVDVEHGEVKIVRAPSAAQINFGVRVDLLSGVGSPVALEDFL